MVHIILLAVVGLVGGGLGAMVGLGGGIFIIPALVLFLDVPIHTAVAASLVAVVATSSSAAAAQVRDDLANVRLGMSMETLTVSGALVGGLVGSSLSRGTLSAVFGGTMVLVSVYLALRPGTGAHADLEPGEVGVLGDTYYDLNTRTTVSYGIHRLPAGLAASLAAGGVSGLLGLGGGFLKVPVMVLAMRVPIRAAVSTSTFMIGVTAAAGAIVYLARGLVDPLTTVPVVLGVTVGAFIGARVGRRVKSSVLTYLLAFVLFALSIQMILSVAGIGIR